MPPISETAIAAQPILYILAVSLIAIIIIFIGLVKWLMDRYVQSLDKVVINLVEQNQTQIELLQDIKTKVDKLEPRETQPKRRL